MNIPIYDGNPTWDPDLVPFGFYNSQPDFTEDAVKVAKFCAIRLGYPLVDIELQPGSFFTAFEEAITTYGNELYSYMIRDNQLSLEGISTGSNLNQSIITPSFEPVIKLSEQYGSEAGSGGNIPYYTGSFNLTSSIQDYSFSDFMTINNLTGSNYNLGLEVKRIFYQRNRPASAYLTNNYEALGGVIPNTIMGVGGAGMGYGGGYLMVPLSYNMQVMQHIEMAQQVINNNYSFEIKNDKLRIFPIPTAIEESYGGRVWFEYILRNERINNTAQNTPSQVTNISNAPYTNPNYNFINSIGRKWIFEYTLALCKEMLGYIRGKYSSIPIPNSEISLNQSDLLSAATSEKLALIERLRTYLDETSRQSLLARRTAEADSKMAELQKVPYTIFIA